MSVFSPNLPGVPSLLQPLNIQGVALAVANVTGIGLPAPRIWAIFNQFPNGSIGNQALFPDSIVTFDFKIESQISNAPMEQGAFETYNKVQMPSHVSLLLTKGGSDADRQLFLEQVQSLQQSLSLLTILTPEATYSSMNLERYSQRRTAREGFTLLQIEAHFVLVRVTAVSAFSNTAAASGAASQTTTPLTQLPNTLQQQGIVTGFQTMPQTAQMFGLNAPGS